MSAARFFLGFRGRTGRARYWLYLAIALPSLVALVIVSYLYALSIPGAYENGGPTPLPSGPFGIAAAIAWAMALFVLFAGYFAATVKRLHDRGKSAWWLFVFVFLPNAIYAFGEIAVQTGFNSSAIFLIRFVAAGMFVWAFIELGCLRGTRGNNRFGPDPLAGKAIAAPPG